MVYEITQNTKMSCKTKAKGTFLEVDGYGQIEVEPGSEQFIRNVLKQYMNVNSGVKVTRAPNYVGRYSSMSGPATSTYEVDTPSSSKRKK